MSKTILRIPVVVLIGFVCGVIGLIVGALIGGNYARAIRFQRRSGLRSHRSTRFYFWGIDRLDFKLAVFIQKEIIIVARIICLFPIRSVKVGFRLFSISAGQSFIVAKVKIMCKNVASGRRCHLFSAGESSSSTAPNKACSGRGDSAAFSGFFYTRTESCSWSFIYARPTAANANR